MGIGVENPAANLAAFAALRSTLGVRVSATAGFSDIERAAIAAGTSSIDFGAVLQSIHDAAPAAGLAVDFSEGLFKFLTFPSFTKPMLLSGRGRERTTFRTDGLTGTFITTSAVLDVRDIGFQGDYGSAQNGAFAVRGVLSTGGYNPTFHRCDFLNLNIGVEFTAAWRADFLFCRFWDCKTNGIRFRNVASPDKGDHVILGCEFANGQAFSIGAPALIQWFSSGGLRIIGNKALGGQYFLSLTPEDGVATSNVIVDESNSIEGFSKGSVYAKRSGTTGTLTNVQIGGQHSTSGFTGVRAFEFGAGIADFAIKDGTIIANCDFGTYVGDDFTGGGLISSVQHTNVKTLVRDSANGSNVSVMRQSYREAPQVIYQGRRDVGAARPHLDLRDSTSLEAYLTNFYQPDWLYKIYVDSNRLANFTAKFSGVQQGQGAAGFVARCIVYNNGSIQLSYENGTGPVYGNNGAAAITFQATGGVVGTPSADEDGIAIGIKGNAALRLQGIYSVEVEGSWKLRRLTKTNIRTGSYTWTLSGHGMNEYYLQLSGGNPGLLYPGMINRAFSVTNLGPMSRGTLGSLAANTWAYGDNDMLGYSTIYVRLSDDSDPDTQADGWLYAFA